MKRPEIRLEPDRPPIDDPALEDINALPRLARALRVLTQDGGAIPADSKHVEAAIRAQGDPDVQVMPEQLDALVALGTLQRVMIGTTMHLVWRSDARDHTVHLPRTVEPVPPVGNATNTLPDEDFEFRLDISLDIERERLLFYRVVLVLELLGAALILRQFLLWYFVG